MGPSNRFGLQEGQPDNAFPDRWSAHFEVQSMKIVLQNINTLNYVHSHGNWTPHVAAAIGFTGVVKALDYAINRRLSHVRVSMRFCHSVHNIDFPPVNCVTGATAPS